MTRLLGLTVLLSLFACNRDLGRVGGDRDKHGCLLSGGYTWCAKENACLRIWEFAKEKKFPSVGAAQDYCDGGATKKP
jgi:hypothetical protein